MKVVSVKSIHKGEDLKNQKMMKENFSYRIIKFHNFEETETSINNLQSNPAPLSGFIHRKGEA